MNCRKNAGRASQAQPASGADETLTLHSPRDVIQEYILFIVEDADGVLWLGGLGGRLYRYTISTDEFVTIEFDFKHHHPSNPHHRDRDLQPGRRARRRPPMGSIVWCWPPVTRPSVFDSRL